jgi:hypothetical protein
MKHRHLSMRECHKVLDWYQSKYRTLWCIEYPEVHWPERLDWCLLAEAELSLRSRLNHTDNHYTAHQLWQQSEQNRRKLVITDYYLIEWPSDSFNLAPEHLYLWLLLNWVVNKRHPS